ESAGRAARTGRNHGEPGSRADGGGARRPPLCHRQSGEIPLDQSRRSAQKDYQPLRITLWPHRGYAALKRGESEGCFDRGDGKTVGRCEKTGTVKPESGIWDESLYSSQLTVRTCKILLFLASQHRPPYPLVGKLPGDPAAPVTLGMRPVYRLLGNLPGPYKGKSVQLRHLFRPLPRDIDILILGKGMEPDP